MCFFQFRFHLNPMMKKTIEFELPEILFFFLIIQLKREIGLLFKEKLLKKFVQLFHHLCKGWGADKILSADSSRLQHNTSWFSIFWIHIDPCPTPAGTRNKDSSVLPSSQCGPTALYRRPPVASTLPPCLAAPPPGKGNKIASVEEETKNKQYSARKVHEMQTGRN